MLLLFQCNHTYDTEWLESLINDEETAVWADNPDEEKCIALTVREIEEILYVMRGTCPICG